MIDGITADRILSHQLAELGQAGRLRRWVLLAQLALAFVASASVFTDHHPTLLTLAVVGTILILIWLSLDRRYRRHRAAGDEARRILLVLNGLEEEISGLDNLTEHFSAPIESEQDRSVQDYFATRAPAGMRRLAEMTDESAFFTGALQRKSGELMFTALLGAIVVLFSACLLAPPMFGASAAIAFVRIVMALMVFILSSDLLGTAFGHLEAGSEMQRIRLRITAARVRNFPTSETILIMTDYNAAVEGAPMPIPGIYSRMEGELNLKWANYKATHGIGN